MQRRKILAGAALTPLALSLAAGARTTRAAIIADMQRTVVNVMLYGGMDTRFIFMPAPTYDRQYIEDLWEARSKLYGGSYPNYTAMFDAEYLAVTDGRSGLEFGIHKSCGWLHSEWQAGRVAVVANTFGASNRRHDQAALNVEVGDPFLTRFSRDRDGWGGRLVDAVGGDARCIELGGQVTTFSKGYDPTNRLVRVVHAQDTRNIALPRPNASGDTRSRNVLARAMRSYYTARGAEIATSKPADWAYRVFFDHFAAFESLDESLSERLPQVGPMPPAFAGANISRNSWRQQCMNLYDVCLLHDILGARCVSMSLGGFDTHVGQEGQLSRLLADLFGANGGLAAATAEIGKLAHHDIPPLNQLTFTFNTDFGRQLKSNGSNGTDHGNGLYSILVGADVSGGTYGEMFPLSELESSDGKEPRMLVDGAAIEGLTSTERVVEALSDWVSPGIGTRVAYNSRVSPIEVGGLLDGLMGGAQVLG